MTTIATWSDDSPWPSRHLLAVLLLSLVSPLEMGAAQRCPSDAVPVGPVCVDRYEASVWQVPPGKKQPLNKIQRGEVTLKMLLDGGATQVGAMTQGTCVDVSSPETFRNDGTWSQPLYAVSVPGVLPTTCTSWFQAEQACRLSGKRLLSNADWQAAARAPLIRASRTTAARPVRSRRRSAS